MFENPLFLWALLFVPLVVILLVYSWRCFKKFEQSPRIASFLYASRRPGWAARRVIAVVWLVSLSLLILGLAQPYVDVPTSEKKHKNVRIFFVVDVSRSMVYAEDIKPNRMVAARSELVELYKQLDGHYECSIIPFAGSPNVYYCPLTYSKRVILPLLEDLGPDTAPEYGTDLVKAVSALQNILKQEKLDQDGINLIILVSDGGKEEAEATNRVRLHALVQSMASKNCKFFTVGVGGRDPCELIKRYGDGSFDDFLKEDGKIQVSHLDEEILQAVADQGNGKYCHFHQKDQMRGFVNEAIQRNRIEEGAIVVTKRVYLEYYLYALCAILLWFGFIANKTYASETRSK